MTGWTLEIEAMIVNHHKVTSARPDRQSLVESFRRADWIDVTRGLRRFGLPLSSLPLSPPHGPTLDFTDAWWN